MFQNEVLDFPMLDESPGIWCCALNTVGEIMFKTYIYTVILGIVLIGLSTGCAVKAKGTHTIEHTIQRVN